MFFKEEVYLKAGKQYQYIYIFQCLESQEPQPLTTARQAPVRASKILRFQVTNESKSFKIGRCAHQGDRVRRKKSGFRRQAPVRLSRGAHGAAKW